MNLGNKTFTPLIPEADIILRIKELANKISIDLADKDPLFIVILNGAFLFAADLIKEIKIPCRVSFIKVSSYEGTQSSGKIEELIGLKEIVAGKHLVLLDDIVDTGHTMANVISNLTDKNPASISICTLLLKPEAFGKQFTVDYVGFTIPNEFIVGYGLDYDGYGRNLKDIYKLAD